ncbi:MAG: site-specific DNA-methyltransferase [Actinobacteria bacterium]|nr:site-specific DNA-methyltransferase [Actinomycetota bacterium]
MPRAKKSNGPAHVGSYVHPDKRVNNPTADAVAAYGIADDAREPLLYPRDPSLDPQLVWKGKDAQDREDLVVDAPPIYIQEKIDPRVLIENLRKTAAEGQPEPELTLFDSYDELDEVSQVEFYQHQESWKNRMILGDSLQVMGSLAEREGLRGKVQMIYIDPPYGIKFGSNWQVSARKRDVKDGNLADAVREAEQIKAFRDTWELGIHSYLAYLRDRLVVARDLLTESGSVFVQIGDENVHLVRALLDEVLGAGNFVSEISFLTTSSQTAQYVGSVADTVIWYAKAYDALKYRQIFLPKEPKATGGWGFNFVDHDGQRRPLTKQERSGESPLPAGRLYMLDNLVSQGPTGAPSAFEFGGRTYSPGANGHWKTHPEGMRRLATAGRVIASTNQVRYARFFDDFAVQPISNIWVDTTQAGFVDEKTYVVQTVSKVVQRCMLMCTDPGDLVVDPTCGSGTTAFVAEQWGRRWITIDTSRVALALARQRLMGAKYPYYLLADSPAGVQKEQELVGKPLPRASTNGDIRHGFVYERVQHITLKSIANNPDIREGMSRAEIDAAIKRYADYELLYDKPFEDKNKIRVSGPFTVESLSPHRSLSFEEVEAEPEPTDVDDASFEASVLERLQTAGIQNGRKAERLEFATVEPYPGQYLQAIGERRDGEDGAPAKVAIALGPQYGTVSPAYIKSAAKEAIAAGIELVAVLGFAFDPKATGVLENDGRTVEVADEGFARVAGERHLGRTQVLLVRMNADLLMGELKNTKAGNLFTVFGEPDLHVRTFPDGTHTVTLHGVDVYDPTTGATRSAGIEQIALWMIDTDYNEESFFVRHCYFTGGGDPYKKLKTALKAEIDPDAWATLYSDTSQHFDRPASGKIAVKVINDYGDEVMKVLEVS